jgi:hypothetical protein
LLRLQKGPTDLQFGFLLFLSAFLVRAFLFKYNPLPRRRNVPVEIQGALPKPLENAVKEVLHRALNPRPQRFVVHISWPHADLIVHIQRPFDRRLKFSRSAEAEIARELYTTVSAIVDEECGPIETT